MNYLNDLNNADVNIRLNALEHLINEAKEPVRKDYYVNNHIHTFYSFSPYSPSKAIYSAYMAGLATAGIMDHDSVSGCREFLKAGDIAGIGTTIGCELRCDISKTALKGKHTNNPDQASISYVALHGIPHGSIDMVADFLKPYAKERDKRNRAMIERLNSFSPIKLDYDAEVVPLSKQSEGGSITERHLLFALAKKILASEDDVLAFLDNAYQIKVTGKLAEYITDKSNPYIEYDLLGVLKSTLIEQIYIPATAECPDVTDYIKLAKDSGGIAAYPYLGDIGDSVTGDKKTQKFEDEYLDLLFEEISRLGFDAVTYMPARNTTAQLTRIKEMCAKYSLMEISGEDINTPRQSFICEKLKDDMFKNLVDSTWELIKHERK